MAFTGASHTSQCLLQEQVSQFVTSQRSALPKAVNLGSFLITSGDTVKSNADCKKTFLRFRSRCIVNVNSPAKFSGNLQSKFVKPR